MERRDYYAVHVMFLFVAAFIDRSSDFLEKCDLTRIKVLYTERANGVHLYHKGGALVESEVLKLRTENREFKCVVESCSRRIAHLVCSD